MILMYHKVAPVARTPFWVSTAAFRRQVAALGDRRVVTLADYDPTDRTHCVITFDDACVNVLTHAAPVLAARGLPFEVFVNGGLMGRWNRFDQPQEPPVRACSLGELDGLVAAGGRLQWHTRDHKSLYRASLGQAVSQLSVPTDLWARYPAPHFRWFSYPYGHLGGAALTVARAWFDGAVAVEDAARPGERHRLPRLAVTEASDLSKLWAAAGRPLAPVATVQAEGARALAAAERRRWAMPMAQELPWARAARSLRAIARPLVQAASTRAPRHQSPPATSVPSSVPIHSSPSGVSTSA